MDLEKIKAVRDKQAKDSARIMREYQRVRNNSKVLDALKGVNEAVKNSSTVEIANKDLAKSGDLQDVRKSIDELNLTTFMASQNWLTGLGSVVNNLTTLAKDIDQIHSTYKVNSQLSDAQKKSLSSFDALAPIIARLERLAIEIKNSKVTVDSRLATSVADAVDKLNTTITRINWNPKIDVPKVEVPQADLSGLIKPITEVKDSIAKLKFPETRIDLGPLQKSMDDVSQTINNLKFPIPNYVLPYKNTAGNASQAPVPFIDVPFDYISFTNADANGNYQTWLVKQGGSGGTTVRTITASYDVNSNITSLGRS